MELVTLDQRSDEQRHVLLDHRTGWRLIDTDAVEEEACEGDLSLLALPANGRPLVDAAGTFGGLTEPTGVAVDPFGVIYVADAAANVIKRYDPCCGEFEALPCLGGEGGAPRRLRSPHGLAIASDGTLYVADTDNRRVQLISVKGIVLLAVWGPLDKDGRRVAAGDSAAWRPWDIALDSRGRAFVSDRENALVHVFDRHGHWTGTLDGHGPGTPPFRDPTSLAVDVDDRLYVAQDGVEYVTVISSDGSFVGRAGPPQGLAGRFRPAAVAADAAGNLFVADTVTRRLYCYRCSGAPGTPVRFTGGVCKVEGPTAGLAFDSAGNPLAVDPGNGRIFRLEGSGAFAKDGRAVTDALDSRIQGCTWHRIVIDGQLPPGDEVQVETLTADIELALDEILALPESAWSSALSWTQPDAAEWECLVLSPPGRYLWLRLTLHGSGKTTPTVRSAKVYFPRASSIEFLPAVYRATPPDSTFLERFLSIFDTVFASVEGVVDRFPAYLDADSAPAKPTRGGARGSDFLSWLASWFGVVFEGQWNEARRRNILRHVATLYRRRGTVRGLREAVLVGLGLDPDQCAGLPIPGILEGFKLRRWLFVGNAQLGDNATLWGKRIVDRLQLGENATIGSFKLTGVGDPLRDPFHVYAHRFTLFLPASVAPNDDERAAIRRIVELTKPAHTYADLEFVEPRLRVGVQATIGMDTAIGRYPAGVRAGANALGYDSVLQDPPNEPKRPELRVGVRARIGSTVL